MELFAKIASSEINNALAFGFIFFTINTNMPPGPHKSLLGAPDLFSLSISLCSQLSLSSLSTHELPPGGVSGGGGAGRESGESGQSY